MFWFFLNELQHGHGDGIKRILYYSSIFCGFGNYLITGSIDAGMFIFLFLSGFAVLF